MESKSVRLKICPTNGDYPRLGASLISLSGETEFINIAGVHHA